MTTDDLNVDAQKFAHELTQEWRFTGWKPGQGTTALLGQWLSKDWKTEIQVGPIYPPYVYSEEKWRELSRDALKVSLERGPAPENRPELLLVIHSDDPEYDKFKERATLFQNSHRKSA